MSETETQTPQTEQNPQDPEPPKDDDAQKNALPQFSIWPPSQRTREAVTKRLTDTLSTPSVLSKRYGTMSSDEASATARQIEDEAFAAANSGGSGAEEDGIDVLQVYSKEISKRMLEVVKARNASNANAEAPSGEGGEATEEVSASVENAEN